MLRLCMLYRQKSEITTTITHFYTACALNQLSNVEKYLKETNYTNIDLHDDRGYTGLHYACRNGNIEVAQLLLDNKANMNMKTTDENETPITLACQESHLHIIKLLISRGCNINVSGTKGKTGLHYACLNRHAYYLQLPIVKTLINNNADLDAKTFHNDTPLLFACLAGHLGIVKLLVSKGCNIFAECNFGGSTGTALDAARNAGHKDIVNYLESKMRKSKSQNLDISGRGYLEYLELKDIDLDDQDLQILPKIELTHITKGKFIGIIYLNCNYEH